MSQPILGNDFYILASGIGVRKEVPNTVTLLREVLEVKSWEKVIQLVWILLFVQSQSLISFIFVVRMDYNVLLGHLAVNTESYMYVVFCYSNSSVNKLLMYGIQTPWVSWLLHLSTHQQSDVHLHLTKILHCMRGLHVLCYGLNWDFDFA